MILRKSFDRSIYKTERDIIDLITNVKEFYMSALETLLSDNKKEAKKLIKNRDHINELHAKIIDYSTLNIIKQQPVATDLRKVIGYISIARELESIGNYGVHICNYVIKYEAQEFEKQLIAEHIEMLCTLFAFCVDAVKTKTEESCLKIQKYDKDLDDYYNNSFNELIKKIKLTTHFKESQLLVATIQQLKYIERSGDHVVNIAEAIIYLKNGKLLYLK